MPDTLVFDLRVHGLDAIKKAAYRFSDVISVDIRALPETVECVVHFASGVADAEKEKILAAFRCEVLDQDLRTTVAKETEAVRNAILAYAFSKTGLQGSE